MRSQPIDFAQADSFARFLSAQYVREWRAAHHIIGSIRQFKPA